MTVATVQSRKWLRPLLWSGALGALWVVLALLRPETTFHLAPLLIAGTPPVLYVVEAGDPDRRRVAMLGAAGAVIALAATALVAMSGSMDGPPFEGFSGPLPEALILTAIGVVAGTGFGILRNRT